jgi:hypothetical protein
MGMVANRPLGPVGAAQVILAAAHQLESGNVLSDRSREVALQALADITEAVCR